MVTSSKFWQKIFLFSAGLTAGAMFCMKWMEGDLVYNGKIFSILGLEISYSKEKVLEIFAGIDEKTRTILKYHLSFDFAFMAGVFPLIASLNMMARQKHAGLFIRKILLGAAITQLLAWLLDIIENTCMLRWLHGEAVGSQFGIFHFVVATKWLLAVSGAILAVYFLLKKSRKTIF